jgi:predicted TIM-barrel fold metal-dependent hydrolase
MKLEDLILVSVDDHAIEPRGAFDRHMPAKFKGRQPKVEQLGGRDIWVFEEQATGYMGLNSVVGRPKEEYGMEPLGYEQMRRGTWDIKARVDDMNANGVLGSLCFPTFPGFAGQRFQVMPTRPSAWLPSRPTTTGTCTTGATPPRPLHPADDGAMVGHAGRRRRSEAAGCPGRACPDAFRQPHRAWLSVHPQRPLGPLWKACADNNVVICCHIGTGVKAAHASDESPIDAWITSMPISIANSAADWIWAPMWKKYPKLRMALSEGGIGWIPYLLERADFTHNHHKAWTNSNFGGKKPSDIFNEHIITCFIEDAFGLKNLDAINVDMVTWECDYPHSDCTWPKSANVFWKQAQHLPDEIINKISHLNAMREFSYDPFAILGRENCTVGALRAQAGHVSIEPALGMGGAAPERDPNKPVTSGDINKMFAAADAQTAL